MSASYFGPVRSRSRDSSHLRRTLLINAVDCYRLVIEEDEKIMHDRPFSERELIAHHEAAHAVIAIELGVGLVDVGIDLDRVDATGGIGDVGCRLFLADLEHNELSDLEDEQRRLAGLIDCSGTVLAAGAASDAKLQDEDPWNALRKQGSDFKHMRELLRRARLDQTPELEEERLRSQLNLAVQALNDPTVWKAVKAIARAALDRDVLTGADIEALAKPTLEPENPKA